MIAHWLCSHPRLAVPVLFLAAAGFVSVVFGSLLVASSLLSAAWPRKIDWGEETKNKEIELMKKNFDKMNASGYCGPTVMRKRKW